MCYKISSRQAENVRLAFWARKQREAREDEARDTERRLRDAGMGTLRAIEGISL